MGCITSKPATLSEINGDGADFLDRYTLERKIGEGEFGIVKIVRDISAAGSNNAAGNNGRELACKILRKGRVFKDNTLYGPIDPKVLRTECKILSTLAGGHHTLFLHGLYESPSVIYIVTEYCSGGEMMQYVNTWYGDTGLRIDDVTQIAFQLIDAVAHCAKHDIIHRDIKPENIMFIEGSRGSDLRLIDFGSGVIDSSSLLTDATNADAHADNANTHAPSSSPPQTKTKNNCNITTTTTTTKQADGTQLRKHTTFAGSAFYISPEMFKKNYTCKTDVWSFGVTLYVLVAGYPVHALQKAFNALQSSKATEQQRSQELRALPNMPPDMPDSFFHMLETCLVHRHMQRKNAKDILECSFLESRRKQEEAVTESMLIAGTKDRHAYFLQYEKYERAITTLLASMLRKVQLQQLLLGIDNFIDSHHTVKDTGKTTPADYEAHANNKRLQIITIAELRIILSQLQFYEVVSMMDAIPSDVSYDQYAYHIALLRQFITYEDESIVNDSNSLNAQDNYNPELDNSNNSIGRKWKKVINLRTKYNKNNTETSAAMNITNRTLEEESDDVLDHSVSGNKVWDQRKESIRVNHACSGVGGAGMGLGMGMGQSTKGSGLGMRRNFSTPVLTDLTAYPS